MATVHKDIALELIKRCKMGLSKKYYCIVRYWNDVFQKEDFAYLENEEAYQQLAKASSKVKILWRSDKFKQTRRRH
jgi:hypothetical protein